MHRIAANRGGAVFSEMALVGYAALSGVVSSATFQTAAGKAGEWAADRAFAVLDGFTPGMARAMGDTLLSFRFEPGLPVNHDIERGVTRASLLATLHCLATLNEEARLALADDPTLNRPNRTWRESVVAVFRKTPARTVLGSTPPPFPARNFNHANNAMRWYYSFARRLRHDTGRKEDRAHLIEEATLPVTVADLEQSASRQFGANNAPTASPATNEAAPLPQAPDPARVNSAVLDQIIARGGWPADRHKGVCAALEQALFDDRRKWWLAFSLYYAEELQADSDFRHKLEMLHSGRLAEDINTVSAIMRQLVAGSQERFDAIGQAIQANHEAQLAILADLQKHFTLSAQTVFFDPKGNMTDELSVQSFYFAEEEDEFIGRDDVIAAVESRLLRAGPEVPGFAWAAITGSAGSGKSRLALHLRDRNVESWPISGFVRAQVLRSFSPDTLKPGMITAPTFFILDYAGGNPTKCVEFLAQCAAIAETSAAPIRAMVLVRQTKDRFFDESRKAGDGSLILRTREEFADLPPSQELRIDEITRALDLQSLSDDQLVELMHRRMIKTHALLRGSEPDSPPPRKDREGLLQLLRDYDPHKRRALIALLLADARQRDTLGHADDEDTQEKRLARLLQDHLQWQFEVRWQRSDGYSSDLDHDQKDLIDRHLSFLILATCCRVFTDETWESLLAQPLVRKRVDALLPLMESERSTDRDRNFYVLRRDILQVLAAQSVDAAGDKPYPIIEPDLFGEALLLLVLGPKGENLTLTPSHARLRRQCLVDLAWTAMPEGMAGFLALVEHDFPKALKDLGWCLPSEMTDRSRPAIAELFRFLVWIRLDALYETPPTKAKFEEIDHLLQLAPCEVDDPECLQFAMKMRAELAGDLSAMLNNNNSKKRELDGISAAFSEEGAPETSGQSHEADAARKQSGQTRRVSFVGAQLARRTVRRSREAILLPLTPADWDACRALLRSMADGFEQFLFNPLPLDIRDDYLDALGYMITSVLWKDRADAKKGGRDSAPLTQDELDLRDHIARRAEAKLREEGVSNDDAGLGCQVLSRIIYAEWGAEPARAELPREALARIAKGKDSLHPITISNLVASATNIHYLSASVDDQTDEPEVARRAAIGRELLENARAVLTRTDREPSVDARRSILLSYADLLMRQANTWDRAGWPRDAHHFLADYAAFLITWPGIKSTQDVLVYLCQILRSEALADIDDRVTSETIATLLANGFDPEKNKSEDWNNLNFILFTLTTVNGGHWQILQPLVLRLLDDLGELARDALVSLLAAPMGDTMRDGRRTLELLEAIVERTPEPWDDRKLADLLVKAAGRVLLDGDVDRVWQIADRLAGHDRAEVDIPARRISLELAGLLLAWVPPGDGRADAWIARFFESITADSENDAATSILATGGYEAAARILASILQREVSQPPQTHWRRLARRQGMSFERLRGTLAPMLERLAASEPAPGGEAFARYAEWSDCLASGDLPDRLAARATATLGRMLLRDDESGALAYLEGIRREADNNANAAALSAYLRGLELVTRWNGAERGQLATVQAHAVAAVSSTDHANTHYTELAALAAALAEAPYPNAEGDQE